MPSFSDIPNVLERMVRAVRVAEDRLLRSTSALEAAGIPYAVVGGNAVAYWVATVDEGATRTTPEVNLLVQRADLPAVIEQLTAAGFDHRTLKGVHCFVDRSDGRERNRISLWFAGEKAKESDAVASPDLSEAVRGERFQVITLEGLVRMKLTAFRNKDRMHLRDLMDVGLIDDTWPARFPDVLADRLREILADPEG